MNKKLKVGIFGIRRGGGFANIFNSIPDTEVVAVCDNSEIRVKNFLISGKKNIPTYNDYEKFLQHDMDIVVLCNYCTEHAPAAIKALRSGKHVLSEVIACKTLSEGVSLCREVEKAEKKGIFYMFAENYCYFSYIQEMERIYKAGKIGQLRYGEGEYIHDCSSSWHVLTTSPSHWRNWLPSTYYCTHSLGPIIKITDLRPVQVSGFVVPNLISREYGREGDDWGILIIKMENDAILRIIPWSIGPHDSIWYRIYGTDGMMENNRWKDTNVLNVHFQKLWEKPKIKSYLPEFKKYQKQAKRSGHGGGDFFLLFDFVNSIRKKERPPIDIYKAMDMTLPGILGYRSALSGNIPIEIPDFRKEKERKKYENDNWSPDPNDKKLMKNQPAPSILGEIEIKKEIYEMLEKKREKAMSEIKKQLEKAYKI
ncbi:MAG TPA: Gfo/Idh/MocA family oxidoreductase [Candidatus Ratteibacteria bacterium]|nr:Gfo/Idh/MocA family oxidoreductase [Candidatus Ratteibacteria bacterium]